MSLLKNILRCTGNIMKKILILWVMLILLFLSYLIFVFIKYYYFDGPKFIEKCVSEGNSQSYCQNQFY